MKRTNQASERKYQVLFYLLLATYCLLLIAPIAIASSGGETERYSLFKDYLWKIINFGILFFILFKFGKKPLQSFLKQRAELIEKTLMEAREAKELAQKSLAEVEEKLKLKDKEIEEIISSARLSGEKEREKLIEEGNRLREKILEQARANIDYDLREAKAAIKEEAVTIAMELAEKKIKESLGENEQESLLEDSIIRIEGRK